MGVVSAAMAAAIMIGGVPVQVAGPVAVLPKEPVIEHPEVLWSTAQIMPATSILMTDNSRWVVKAKQTTGTGTRVVIVPMAGNVTLMITVPAASINTPIWWVGEVVENPGPADPGTGEDPNENPDGPVTPPPPPPDDPPPTDPPPPGVSAARRTTNTSTGVVMGTAMTPKPAKHS